MTICDEMVLVH